MSGALASRIDPLELAVEIDVDDLGGLSRSGAEVTKTFCRAGERSRENGRLHREGEAAEANEKHVAASFECRALFEHDCGPGNPIERHTHGLSTGETEPVSSGRSALNDGLTHISFSSSGNNLPEFVMLMMSANGLIPLFKLPRDFTPRSNGRSTHLFENIADLSSFHGLGDNP